jgi:hypothetical protein
MCKLLIGCPVTDRNWILPTWFKYAQDACDVAGVDAQYVFLVPEDDEETIDCISEHSNATIALGTQQAYPGDHKWSGARYENMVSLRNELLSWVRIKHPDYFFSLDSDILLHPHAIRNLLEDMEDYDYWAVGSKCYLSRTSVKFPNAGTWVGRGFRRANTRGVSKVGVIMAAKMMGPDAYNTDYQYHSMGEDLGWSRAVIEAGGTLGFDGRVTNKHIMDERRLDLTDDRVGW